VEQVVELVVRATTAATHGERIDAYGRLVERFKDMACGYAYSLVGDFHLAEDVAQDAFIAAFGNLGQLQQPEAFPGWFRRIVWSQCGRATRRKPLPAAGLEAAAQVVSAAASPQEAAERKEMTDQVLAAIRGLPEPQREVTALFYINGYSQKDIADFLEVPVGTVKNRLNASRGRLKERMLNMVKDTLHRNAPDERFNIAVIDGLLSRPRPLEIPGHPVREAWEAVCKALPAYEVIQGEEIVNREMQIAVSGGVGYAYPEGNRVLRTSGTGATFRAMVGRTPPVRLLTAGRVFRVHASGPECGVGDGEDATHMRVFHEADGLCADKGADFHAMQALLEELIKAVLGVSGRDVRWEKWEKQDSPSFLGGVDLDVRLNGKWTTIAAGGMIPAKPLREAGLNPDEVECFGFGLGLERVAMLKFGIDDIRKLWRPPYVPGK
jgi:RNA polymerase sigma factor (sigma-70 family)